LTLAPIGNMRTGLIVVFVTCLSLAPVLALSAAAQDASRETWEKTDEELDAEGWEVRGSDRAPGSVGCGLWAIPVSLVWGGWGHRCAGDDDSHFKLLALEGVAIRLIATAATIAIVSNDADSLNPVWSALFYSGSVLYVSGYIFDLLGTFKGSSRALYENHQGENGFEPRVVMRWVPTDSFDLKIIAGLKLPLVYERFWLEPSGLVDTTDLAYWQVRADTGFKLFASGRANSVAIAAESRYESFDGLGFKVLTLIPYIETSVDVGEALAHLRGLFFVNRIGYGFEFYDWAAVESDGLFKDRSSLFILESGLSMNVLETVNFELSYQHRPDLLVGGLDRAGTFLDLIPTPGVGIVGFKLDFETSDAWSFELDSYLGTVVEFWLGFGRKF